jgi:outer membrane lipoprotein-sorting protein
MRRSLCILLALGIAASAAGQDKPDKPEGKQPGELTDVKEILKKADAETRRVQSARYKFEFAPSAAGSPTITGTVILASGSAAGLKVFHMDLKMRQPTSMEPRQVTLGSDGETTYAIDHAKRIVYADIDSAVLGSFTPLLRQAAMLEYVHPTPFSDEIHAEKAELRGKSRINEEECHEVYVKYKDAPAEAVWYFSVKDFLPRCVHRIGTPPGGGERLQTRLVILSLEPDPKLDPDTFKLKVPEGYTRTDEPAP